MCVIVSKVGNVALAMSAQTAKYPAQPISDGREKICFLEALCPKKGVTSASVRKRENRTNRGGQPLTFLGLLTQLLSGVVAELG
ncbi:MAG: hypothetical protein DMF60_01905 [Acidobacteria bacterium]|nr:MAG: hypothetical protein DMF60_01905 [Acidobacteriota bacterium]